MIVLLGVTGSSSASEFAANFDAYVPGLGVHGRDGWKGWDNVAATDALVSNLHARSGQNSLRILSNTDIVHEFKLAGGKWVVSAMQYIPSSGATGITYFILLNTYRDGGPCDWSAQTEYNMTTGTITPWHGATGSNTKISYDRWVEIKFVIDLTANTFEEYYNSVKIAAGEWDNNTHGTLQAIDLFGNGSSSVYYDDIQIDSDTVNTDDRASDVAIQSDGKIVVVGGSIKSHGEFAVARYNTDGSLDTSFGRGGLVTTDLAWGYSTAERVIIQPDGKILVGGDFDDRSTLDLDFALVRYNADGSLDTTFGGDGIVTTNLVTDATGTRSSDRISDIALQSDGKIVVVGTSHIDPITGDSSWDFALARYDQFGNLDPTFSGDGMVITPIGTDLDRATSVAIRPDGKIVVAGHAWDLANQDYALALAQYKANGSLDLSFSGDGKQIMDISSGNDFAESMVLQPDGKIVLVGSSFDGSRDTFLLARYNSDGTRDTSFMGAGIYRMNIGAYEYGNSSVALQPDGKIVVAGFSVSSGSTYMDFALVRCNTNGSLDESFGVHGMVTTDFALSADHACGVALQSNGKIVLAGYTAEFRPPETFEEFDFALTRYNTNGGLDLSFSEDGKVTTNYSVASDLFIASRWGGPVGTIMKLGAQGYPAEEEIGRAFFDSDRDGVLDAGEPSVILRTSLAGDITFAKLTVPSVAPGSYPVQFDVPSGGAIEESRTFTVTQPFIVLGPWAGPLWTPIAVTGVGFIPNSSGSVYLDLDSNGRWDSSETKQTVTTNGDGVFTASLTPPYSTMFPPGYKGYYNFVVRTNVPGDGGPNAVFAVFQMVP